MPAHGSRHFPFKKLWIPSLTVEDDECVWRPRHDGRGDKGNDYVFQSQVLR